jgi:hypothetical protein
MEKMSWKGPTYQPTLLPPFKGNPRFCCGYVTAFVKEINDYIRILCFVDPDCVIPAERVINMQELHAFRWLFEQIVTEFPRFFGHARIDLHAGDEHHLFCLTSWYTIGG